MPSVGDSIKVLSANCQGLQNIKKRIDVLSYFKETNANIICLQDTHLIDDDIMVVKELWTKSKLGFYVPFNSQGHIGTGPQNCHLWDSNPHR